MKNPAIRFILICLSLVLAHSSLNAQDPTLSAAAGDRYVISAKAGAINFVEGSVTVARKHGKSGQLVKGDSIEVGDRVTTENDGKVEILLNPGSYLRLGGNSAFEFVTTSLDDLRLKVDRGSAIFEVFAAEDFKVIVIAPKTKYLLVDTGVYRVDVESNDQARLRVWKGAARVGATHAVKSGRAAAVDSFGDVSVAKFDRDEKDALDVWSKARSKELAKMSAQLKRDHLRPYLMRSFLGRGWNVYNSFGLWVFNPFFGGYCFLPFGYGWSSPYGYGYGHSLWWYELPPVVYMPPGGSGPTNPGGGNTNPPTATPIVSAGTRGPIPPFVRMQETMGGGFRGGGRDNTSYDSSTSSPSYSSPSSSSSSPAPSTTRSDTSGKSKP
jgi:hypothetical protein